MSQSKDLFIYQHKCKDCGDEFYFTEKALEINLAFGLSKPSSCRKCRVRKVKAANEIGLSYCSIPAETNFTSRSLEEVGLARVDRQVDLPKKIEYRPNKNIAEKFQILEPVVNALIQNLIDSKGSRVSILIAPTGTGKSVWVTSQILKSSIGTEGQILVTQPRTVTLRTESKDIEETTPGYIATQILGAPGVGAGHEVGLAYRGEWTKKDQLTKLLFVTDGLLINWILSGDIGRYSVIIIDEAHEQSSNMELIFALLRYKLPLYPNLKIVIMSATLDAEKFQTYFQCFGNGKPKKVPVFQPSHSETSTPKTIYDRWPAKGKYDRSRDARSFSLPEHPNEIPEVVAQLVSAICTEEKFTKLKKTGGDILVFVPTIELVNLTKEAIENIPELMFPNLEVLSCHAQMKKEEHEALEESEKRAEQAFQEGVDTHPQRVIIATNYAETSVTLANLCFVIDSGYVLESIWNAKTCTTEFKSVRHSQAGCTQRKGRVGRKQNGEFFRLYSKEQFQNEFRLTPLPEIARLNLEMFLLKAAAAGIGDLESFKWLGFNDDTQEEQKLEKIRAIKKLKKCKAIDEEGYITQIGIQLHRFEVSNIDLALFMYASDRFGCALEVATFLAFVENSTPLFEKNERGLLGYARWSSGCYDDLEYYLRLYYYWHQSQNQHKYNRKEKNAKEINESSFSKNVFLKIQKKRNILIKQLYSENSASQKKLGNRQLDLDRLHRVRLLLVNCMPEWMYVRDSNNTSNRLFVPFDTESCPCAESISISNDSSCAIEDRVKAFICLERSTSKNQLQARHVVRVEPNWLLMLERSEILGISIILQQATKENNRQLSEATRRRVLDVPESQVSLHTYEEREVRKFRVIRSQKTDRKTQQLSFLVYDIETHKILIVKFEEKNKHISSGTVFRAYVERVDIEQNILILSQWRFYPKESIIRHIENIQCDKNKCFVELEPGLNGDLNTNNLGESNEWIKQAEEGLLCFKVVRITSNKLIKLEPFLASIVGSSHNGHIIGFLYQEEKNKKEGILVEIAEPNIKGLIPKFEIEESTFSSYQINDKINVTIHVEENGKLILKPSNIELVSLGEELEIAPTTKSPQKFVFANIRRPINELWSNFQYQCQAREKKVSQSVIFLLILLLIMSWRRTSKVNKNFYVPSL